MSKSVEFPEEAEGSDSDHDHSDACSNTTGLYIADMPIVTQQPDSSCVMCLIQCSVVSPLAGKGGHVPWCSYKKSRGKKSRSPYRRLCAICRNTYKALGWKSLYGTVKVYAKNLGTREGKERHLKLLKSRVQFTKDHGKSPTRKN